MGQPVLGYAQSIIRLSIAKITIGIESNNAWLIKQLKHRYQGYLFNENTQLTTKIYWTADRVGKQKWPPEIVFSPGGVHFNSPGYEGYIDEQQGEAVLKVRSSNPIEGVEYFLRVIYALLVFREGGLLIHGAGILHKGSAYLFIGHSGSGKTTIARYSMNNLVMNDDLIIIMSEQNGWRAYSTPFWNPDQVLPTSLNAPLSVIFKLIQDQTVYLELMSKAQSLAELVSNIPIVTADPSRNEKVLRECFNILSSIPSYKLHFLPDGSFWDVIQDELTH
jgi:hypothetical protein